MEECPRCGGRIIEDGDGGPSCFQCGWLPTVPLVVSQQAKPGALYSCVRFGGGIHFMKKRHSRSRLDMVDSLCGERGSRDAHLVKDCLPASMVTCSVCLDFTERHRVRVQ